MVHQHFMLIPVMTVAENIVLAIEPTREGILLDERGGRASACASSRSRSGSPSTRRALVAEHHRRPAAARRDPEGALPRRRHPDPRRADRGADAAGGAGAVRDPAAACRRDGKSIIFISHKLNEVLEIADRITVLRRGKKIETVPREGATEESLARAMVGREVLLRVDKPPRTRASRCSSVEDLHVLDDRGHREGARASRSTSARARSSASRASTATARAS